MANPAVRVLLVGDDEDEYIAVGDLLRAAGPKRFDLTWRSTHERGIEAILASGCDVCLVDHRLGSRSGLELLAEVNAKSSQTQTILLLGDGDRGLDVAATIAAGADYLVKAELTPALLERSIRYAVERGRAVKALQDASELAQSSHLAKSAFLAAMSHEIRTPMNALLGMAEMLWESPLNAEQMQYVEVLRRAGAALLMLINDILDLSKIEAGQLELERTEFNLEEVADQAVELTAVKAHAKGIALLSRLSPSVATFLIGDPTRLRQVLINLLGNAVKFTDSGEVVLTIGNPEPGKPGEIEFSVSDTGIGIEPAKLETIFDDFTQADASTTRKYRGTGLGLGVCRRLVEAMGGCLTATSSEGQGSTFRFAAQFDLAPESTRKVRGALGDLHGKRVLLIDNNATSCFILQETLQAWGLESDTFRSPQEALACLSAAMTSERPFSLAIVDRWMPGMDGFDAAAIIRRVAGALPILMLSSDYRPGDRIRGVDAGLGGYAVKPVSRTNLLRLVMDAMQTRQVAEPLAAKSADREAKERPARILIAEDSWDNRLLVEAYMKGSPHSLTFEENGKAAVDRFATSDFDLILMDVQMPVMDGLAATRAIRALERERGNPSIPIVALTASASLRDVERSTEAGCNAQLSKPISKLELLSAIERYRRRAEPTETAELISSEPVRIEMPSGLEDLVPGYLEMRKKEVREMIELLSASDFARLAHLGHQLKGNGGGYGFPELSRLGAALEESAKQTDRLHLRTYLSELKLYLDRVQLVAKL